MKIAVTDACIFIELHNLLLTSYFFNLDIEVHTTIDVFNELYPEQQELLKAYQAGNKLYLHSLSEENRHALTRFNFLSGLSENDKTVLYVASIINAMILSSDMTVRRQAKKQSIEYHGMFWIFDQLVDLKLITKKDASDKLMNMMISNIIYQGNIELIKEMSIRINRWAK